MADRGFAALPLVDGSRAVIRIVAEADVLRGRLQQDPRLHLRRDDAHGAFPPLLVRGVMTPAVRFRAGHSRRRRAGPRLPRRGTRSVPVLDDERLVGIVSRRDALRALARSDDEIGRDVRRLVDSYTLLDGLAVIPVAVFEFSFGVYLVVKGFKASSPLMTQPNTDIRMPVPVPAPRTGDRAVDALGADVS
jgi:CBS domain-containing protein